MNKKQVIELLKVEMSDMYRRVYQVKQPLKRNQRELLYKLAELMIQ